MDKITYLAELAEGLARWVPERERQDILRYYAEYFEEAGPGREAEVVQELGDPWALSCRLAVEGGFVTQEKANSWTPRRNRRRVWPWVALGSVAAVAIIGISMASFVSQVGRLVGRYVSRGAIGEAEAVTDVYVTDEQAAQAVPVPGGVDSGAVTYVFEGTEHAGGFWSMEDGWLEEFDTIDAEISFGNITVTSGEDYTLFIDQMGDLNGYGLKWEIKGGALKIRDAKSGGAHINFDGILGKHSLDVVVTVPDGAALEKLDVETSLGDVFLSGVFAREKIEAKSALGDIECYETGTPKKLSLKSDLGDVFLGIQEMYQGMDIDLETSLGQVEANLNCPERDCEYELECSLGTVTVNGQNRGDKAERKGNYSFKLEAESDLGDVNVCFIAD